MKQLGGPERCEKKFPHTIHVFGRDAFLSSLFE